MSNSVKTESNSAKLFDKSSLISFDEMAEMLGCSRNALYQRVHRKQIPARKFFGKLVFVQKEFERWLQKKGIAANVQR